ncbi:MULTISPECIES: hypothetical protein [unclassified Agromyces]|uniref:hypothetical protein n=1 Tax=unclassified Agromyces TaxID=2639701 RepID=UPI003014A684
MPAPHDLILIGILLLALVTVESGGYFLTRVVRGHVEANALQQSFFRAGHAHAAVLLVLSVAILAVVSHASLDGFWMQLARLGVPVAAILMPAGFFLSVIGADPKRPNRLIALLWAGAIVLTAALVTAGVGLIAGGAAAL